MKTISVLTEHWRTFEKLCRGTSASGNDIPDAYLAALAIEINAELISFDKGFARYAGLNWRPPF